MHAEHDPKADAVYVRLRAGATQDHSQLVDDGRVVDYDAQDQPIGIELLGVSRGVNLDGLPEEEAIAILLARELPRIRVYA